MFEKVYVVKDANGVYGMFEFEVDADKYGHDWCEGEWVIIEITMNTIMDLFERGELPHYR